MGIIISLIVGLAAGWVAGIILRKRGLGKIGDMIVGVIGSFLGGFIFGLIGFETISFFGIIVAAVAGSIILLFIISAVKKEPGSF